MRRDGSYIKTERIAQIRKEVAKQLPEPVDVLKLRLWVECNIGLSKAKTEEYIETVVALAGWVVADGKILSDLPEV